jgi:hypothetical protein
MPTDYMLVRGPALAFLAGIIGIAFATSFVAQRELVEALGVASSSWSWAYPVAIDSAIVIYGLTAVWCELDRDRSVAVSRLVWVATALSVGFNVAHSPTIQPMILAGSGWAGIPTRIALECVLLASPPAFLACAVHTLLGRVRHAVLVGSPTPAPVLHNHRHVHLTAATPVSAGLDSVEQSIADRRAHVARMLTDGAGISQIAQAVGVSRATIYNDKQVIIQPN